MNKIHYWLSNGLWELVKCHLADSPASDLLKNYLWGAAVAPHQACFASHVLSTPWHQCWMTLKLPPFLKDLQDSGECINNVRQEIDLQFILRNFAGDESVEALFDHIRKNQTKDPADIEVEVLLGYLLGRIIKGCPSSAHSLARNLADVLVEEIDASAESSLMLLASTSRPPPLTRINQLALSPHLKEVFYLLLACQHGSLARSLEVVQQQQVSESHLEYLEKLIHNGMDSRWLFQNILLTNRHFVLHLSDLLEKNTSILELDTQHVPKLLWPLLVLRLWGKPEVSEIHMQNLIKKCKEAASDHVTIRIGFMLDWYLSFSRWSLSQGNQKHAATALENARGHSLLHLINASADLADCDWQQVRSLLHEPWDLHILSAFCCTLLLLRAMVAGPEMLRERVRLGRAAESEQKLDELYRLEVTNRMEQIRELVSSITPSQFRLEVLENLFALLFVTYEDVSKMSPKSSNYFNNSTHSSRGFICTPNILRDTVALLTECAAQMESLGNSEFQPELPSSIKSTQLENRLDRLSESLSEAVWRLQLVVGSDFVAAVNSCNFPLDRHHLHSEWLVDTIPDTGKSKRRAGTEKREESGSQSPGSSGARPEPDRHSDRPSSAGFMNHMLASDYTLVIRCLSQGDLLNAEHIITLMSAEDTRLVLEGELNFKQAENQVRRRLHSMKFDDSPIRTSEDVAPGETSLEAVQQVAAQAVNASLLTSHIERFLSANTLPAIQGCSKVAAGSMLQCMENSVAIVALDLALTASTTLHQFRDLFSLASKHCPQLASRSLPQMTAGKPVGYIAFAQVMMVLLHQINSTTECPPAKFFRTRRASFAQKALKDQDNLWNSLGKLNRDVTQNSIENAKLGGDAVKAQKNVKSTQKVLENLSKTTESSSECLDLGRAEFGNNEMAKSVNYADLLNRYLSDLATLALDFVPSKTDTGELVTFHSLLKQSAVEVLDRLVFQHKVDPSLLEKKTQQLGFNLSASLLAGCAPTVPQGHSMVIQLQPQCIVLNAGSTNVPQDGMDTDPRTAVQSIMTDLLEALKTFSDENRCCEKYLSLKSLAMASNDQLVISILQKTECFKTSRVILSEEEKFSFYVNLTNLMTLHCVLSQPADTSFSSTDCLLREAAIWFMGYDIGGEFVNIGQLRSLVCGDELGQLFSSGRMPVFGETFDPDPRTIFLLPLVERLGSALRLELASMEPACKQLSLAIETFAQHHITVKNGTMCIPPLLNWYLDSVLLSEEPEANPQQGSPSRPLRRLQVLIDFLIENSCSREWLATLKAWSFTDLMVEVSQKSEFPSISLDYCDHIHEVEISADEENNFSPQRSRWQNRQLSESILKHLSQNWRVLTDLVVRLHDANTDVEVGQDVLLDERLRSLEAQLSAWWVPSLAPLFGNNVVLAALHKSPSQADLWSFLNVHVAQKDWAVCWDVLRHLPDFILLGDANLYRLRDLLLFELSNYMSRAGGTGWAYAQKIFDINLKIKCYKINYEVWPGDVAIKLLRDVLCDEPDLNSAKRGDIHNSINTIQVFTTMRNNCEDFERKSWYNIFSLSKFQPSTVLDVLVRSNQVAVFFDWISLDGVLESIEPFIEDSLIVTLASAFPRKLTKLFACLSKEKIQKLYDEAFPMLTSLPALKSVVELALLMGGEDINRYKKAWIGVEILSVLTSDCRSRLLHLAPEPLLIIEQLVMNTCLDSLQLLLKKLWSLDTKGLIKEAEVAELLAEYGARAVSLHIIRVVGTSSTGLNFFVPPNSGFVVPAEVPTREQWVADDQVSVCMCCCMVTFSMFNRRHHCRRCGRVVCASCSANRMKIEGFKDVPVRVCQNCLTWQSKPESEMQVTAVPIDWMAHDEAALADEAHYWTLSLDDTHNTAVRAEFGYEDAPNSALCLAIFNLIPESTEYTSRLLDEGERLLEVLQGGDSTTNPEIDYPVLIQIIRALVVGAKVRYGQAGLNTGVVSCDRLLSQVDVVNLLVRSHCILLIPPEPLSPNAMRSLRNKLVEEELWELAIELSTKAGLSLAGVWAAWGKTLLAAGCWQEARTKFNQCLVPASQQSRSSPLLDEICEIIASTTFSTPHSSHSEVMELLGSLKALACGKVSPLSDVQPALRQYEEQEWYLTRYGNAASLIKFYLKKQKWATAVEHIIQKQLEPDFFNEYVLLPAYKTNTAVPLKTAISSIDPTLENCQRYLTAGCAYLQKNKFLSYLHDMQIFMCDYVRASMTCIQLYQHCGRNFNQLVKNSHLLQTALRHLDQEITATSKRRLEHVMKMDHKDIVRHMNTISRQLETSKYLASCEESNSSFGSLLVKLSWTQQIVPTLFDGASTKSAVAAICIAAGKNVEEGFGLAYRIMQDSALNTVEVLSRVGSLLGSDGRDADVTKLIECINTSGMDSVMSICDQVLSSSISAMAAHDKLGNVESLLGLINNVDIKVKALLDARQMKSAYLLAVKFKKLFLINMIMEEAERAGQWVIRDICRKRLDMSSDTSSLSSSIPSTSSQ